MMIFVINLARRPDRWRKWEKAALKAEVPPYQRWEAVDARKLAPSAEIFHLFRNNDFQNRSGVIACALSHFSVWQHIVKQQLPYGIIFEDDANFITVFREPVLPQDWDLFYYGGFLTPSLQVPGIPISQNIVIPNLPRGGGFCAYAYMLSLKGAEKLINRVEQTGFYRAVDYFMVDAFNELKVYCYSPCIAFQDPAGGTDVQNPERLF